MNVRKVTAGAAALAIAGSVLLAGGANATEPSNMSVSPSNAQSGHTVTVSVYCFQGGQQEQLPSMTVTSPGLARPVHLHWAGSGPVGPRLTGTGVAGNRAGVFTLSFTCYEHWVVTTALTVVCPPAGCVHTGQTPPGAQVPVKPRGAPQTGGGGMAAVVGTW